ncbi:pilus assembly protein PilP [Acinetobacter sp. MD2(2019)]|uniref:pilus assembly protein PilP n=1 Tax=Acinetobacter sp. MD2(2019) TaxID=2605273 RepID=UPI002D1EB484|nr:pilus assembly protein PilP [Acinetobacter sp. MD2(2019)]MEB3753208.1 pilus assembly protein PilP [Acinetobacter sp. MD2(2019)]
MNSKSLSLLALSCVMLAGCSSRMDDVNQQMASIRSQPPLPIEPAPTFDAVPVFNYSAQNIRSPFLQSSLYTELKVMAGKRVYPDLSRQQQPLESYALETLSMKGSMKDIHGNIVALIQTPDGDISRVQVGNYMGLNQGRITKITATAIELVEIISDGHDGYVERPRSLVLIGPAS